MALLKCPECGGNVSEHANFCPSCGCTIEYIQKYYKKLSDDEKKKREKDNKPKSYYSTLSLTQKSFIDKLKKDLDDHNVTYLFVNNERLCGFRKTRDGKLVVYLSTYKDGCVYVHLHNDKEDRNECAVFKDNKKEDYLLYAESNIFGINKSTL